MIGELQRALIQCFESFKLMCVSERSCSGTAVQSVPQGTGPPSDGILVFVPGKVCYFLALFYLMGNAIAKKGFYFLLKR